MTNALVTSWVCALVALWGSLARRGSSHCTTRSLRLIAVAIRCSSGTSGSSTLPVRHGLGSLGECRDGGRQTGLGDLGHHAGVCLEVAVYCELSRRVGVVGVREGQRECLFDLGYRLRVYGGGVVPEGVLRGVLVCTGRTSRRLHGLRCEGVVESLGRSSCLVKNDQKGRKMTGFQRQQIMVVLMIFLDRREPVWRSKYFYKNDMSHGRDRENHCFVTILCARARAKTFICVRLMYYSTTHQAGCRKMETCRIYTRNLVPLSGLRDRDGCINQ